jgi:hypothetical protein
MSSEQARRPREAQLLTGLFALVVLTAIVAVAAQSSRGSGAAGRLPDLDQETPSALEVRTAWSSGRRTYRLGFRSAVRNVGSGPLIVRGRRWGAAMRGDQVVELVDGTERTIANVGSIEYVSSSDHRHWHYLGFDRYELRPAGSGSAAVRDRKSGFCLGDRYRARGARLAAAPPEKVYRGRCGLGDRGRAKIEEGISVGYGDAYQAFLEYQDLPLDGLPAGRYVLVHRVNADGRLRELSYGNNAASVLLDLRWRGTQPLLRVLAVCPDRASCTAPRT